MNEVVSEITKLMRRTLGERVDVTLGLAPEVCPVVVDPAQLEAALANLTTNARDAMPKGGRLARRSGLALHDCRKRLRRCAHCGAFMARHRVFLQANPLQRELPTEVEDDTFSAFSGLRGSNANNPALKTK